MPLRNRRRHYAGRTSLVLRFADATGMTAGSANQRLRGNDRLKDHAVKFAQICGEDQRHAEYQSLRHAMDEAYQGNRAEKWSPELVNEVSEADAVEDAKLVAIQQRILQGQATAPELLDYQKTLMEEIAAKVRCYDAAGTLRYEMQGKAK